MPGWFDSFTDAIVAGDQTYLACDDCGHAALPPRRLCPECGSSSLTREPLSDRGEILSFTEISVTIPKFQGETPYTAVLVSFDEGVTLTGQLRGVSADDVAIGDEVVLETATHDDGMPLITFRSAEESAA
jgi:hypothetical protein